MSIRIISFIVALLLAACGSKSLYSGLSEQEANEMVALLYNTGMSADKRLLNDQSFSVSVPEEYFSRAVEVLRANGYPRNKFKSLGDVFQKEGFVSSPLEERARLNYAQSQELTKTIESIDGVVLARVHLALPKDDPLSDKQKPSSASVFIKHRRGIDLSDRESQIKALVVNSIEGLPYENITVALFPSESVSINYQASTESRSEQSSASPMMLVMSIIIVFFIGIIAWLLWRHQKKVMSNISVVDSSVSEQSKQGAGRGGQ